MVFGIRAWYYNDARADGRPLCPCASCFGGGCQAEAPAKEVTRALVGRRAHKTSKARIGFGFTLRRRPSLDSLASDTRPLREEEED